MSAVLHPAEAPLLAAEEIVALIEQADALRQTRMHGREVFLRHPGDARSAHLGRGLDFEEVRAYQAGDDIRAMDWRTTARTGKPYLKIYREEHHPALHVVIDRGASMRFGTQRQLKITLAARVAITAAVLESSTHACIGASLLDDTLHVLPCLHRQAGIFQLAQLCTQPSPPIAQSSPDVRAVWEQCLRRIASTIPRGSRIVLLSDFHWLFAEARLLLAHLAAQHDLAAIQIFDPVERDLPALGRMPFYDLVQGRLHWVDTTQQRVRAKFADTARGRHAARNRLLAELGIDCYALSTRDDAMDLFLGRADG